MSLLHLWGSHVYKFIVFEWSYQWFWYTKVFDKSKGCLLIARWNFKLTGNRTDDTLPANASTPECCRQTARCWERHLLDFWIFCAIKAAQFLACILPCNNSKFYKNEWKFSYVLKLFKIWVSGSDLLGQRSFEGQKRLDSLESTRGWPWKWRCRAGACSPPGGMSWRPSRPEIWLTVPWRSSLWGFRVNAWPVLPQCLRFGP